MGFGDRINAFSCGASGKSRIYATLYVDDFRNIVRRYKLRQKQNKIIAEGNND